MIHISLATVIGSTTHSGGCCGRGGRGRGGRGRGDRAPGLEWVFDPT